MTDFKKLAFVGLVSLGLATVGSAGCSSSSSSGGTGGTGTGTGGSQTGGTTGTGGTGTGTGGAAGATLGCQTSATPASPAIANFSSADAGIQIMGGFFTYGDTPAPSYTITGTALNVTDVVQISAANHYQGIGIYFNGDTAGTECIDASSFTGVQFDISGSLTGANCTMQFSINDSEHSDSSKLNTAGTGPNDPKAAGPQGSYAPQLAVTAAQISAGTTIKAPFTGTGAPSGGSPATGIDTMKIEGVQWQMTTPLPADGGPTECNLNVNISNVKFY
jgi:hypothetical protein